MEEKVICIDDGPGRIRPWRPSGLVKGKIYTALEYKVFPIGDSSDRGNIGVLLAEIQPNDGRDEDARWFAASRFRPITKTPEKEKILEEELE